MKKRILRLLLLALVYAWCPGVEAQLLVAANKEPQMHKPVQVKQVSLQKALSELESRYNVFIAYQTDLVANRASLVQAGSHSTVEGALDALLKGQGLQYKKVKKRAYILTARPFSQNLIPPAESLALAEPVLTYPMQAAAVTISGKVSAPNGEALPGVTVLLKGTTIGAATGPDGIYSLQAPAATGTLVFSFIGFITKEVPINGRSLVNVTLTEDAKALEEVVVVGYGTQKKGDVTGAVGSVKFDQEISSRPMVEFGQALSGKVAGVQVLSASGKPGSSSTVQIRGIASISANSSPLIVVDGNPLPSYDLNLINSADIESIEILKDASSAAIYGSRGGNGVILITTKSGKSGKARLDLNYTTTLQTPIDRVEMMNAREYAQAAIDAAQNAWIDKGGNPLAPNTLAARGAYKYTWPEAFNNPETLADTDFQDVVFRVAPMHKIDLSVSGGNEKSNYLISGGYISQEGIVINSDYSKYAFNIKAATKIVDWVEVGGKLSAVYDLSKNPFDRIVEWAVQYPAIYPVYGDNGFLGDANNTPGFRNYDNILFRAKNGHPLYQINDDRQTQNFNSLGNVYTQFEFLPGLRFKTALNFFFNRSDNSNYAAVDHNMGPSYYTEGVLNANQERTINYNLQNLLTYDKAIGNHSFSALLGYEYLKNDFYNASQSRNKFDNDQIHYLSAGQVIAAAADNASETVLISSFARASYNFKNKYITSVSFRRDGSSRFGPNKKWGNFPSVSLGWIVSDEPFMASLPKVNNVKLRASYGFTGNDRIGDYRWIGSMQQGRVAFGTTPGISYYPSSISNPDLGWERTQQLNFGLDYGMFNNRISLEADYYISKSDGLLLDVPIPQVSGFSNVFKNIGELENKGIELALTTQNITGLFEWSTQLNFSRNRNQLTALGPNNAPLNQNANFALPVRNEVGQPIFSFYGYHYIGVYKNQAEIDADPSHLPSTKPGDGRYEDINKDGKLTSDDRMIIGNPAPDFTYGITNNFKYKNIDLSILFQGVEGNEVFDNNMRRSLFYHEGRNYSKSVVNRWRSEAEPGDGYQHKLTVDLHGLEHTPSSFWIVDGSYFRLKSLTLGYNVPSDWISKMKLSSVRLYFNGQNLFTAKNANLFDPENFNGGADQAMQRGVSHSPYPTAKTYSLGINIGL